MNAPETLIAYRLGRARETLEDAKLLFNQNHLFSTINRLYYALFYCVQALMAARGLSSAKHSGVMATFNREFIKTGTFAKEYGQLYKMLFESRQRSDYQDFVSFERAEVEQWLERTAEFMAIVESHLGSLKMTYEERLQLMRSLPEEDYEMTDEEKASMEKGREDINTGRMHSFEDVARELEM